METGQAGPMDRPAPSFLLRVSTHVLLLRFRSPRNSPMKLRPIPVRDIEAGSGTRAIAGVFWVALQEIALPAPPFWFNVIRMLAVFEVMVPGKLVPGVKLPET